MTRQNNGFLLGTLNPEIFSFPVSTAEVIITDERIQHINEGHPGDYTNYSHLIPQIISDPDYILTANRPDTILLIKKFTMEAVHLELVLKLKLTSDNPEYKNSILSFWKIDRKEYNRLSNNKKVLYKRG
ncbi:MAG: hypothetical protein LBN97_05150 [Oscillospiraceae bacterium]|jgi:hypothetical protein|nr:hypothetical protein [Oscillospiraceae bacterium]